MHLNISKTQLPTEDEMQAEKKEIKTHVEVYLKQL